METALIEMEARLRTEFEKRLQVKENEIYTSLHCFRHYRFTLLPTGDETNSRYFHISFIRHSSSKIFDPTSHKYKYVKTPDTTNVVPHSNHYTFSANPSSNLSNYTDLYFDTLEVNEPIYIHYQCPINLKVLYIYASRKGLRHRPTIVTERFPLNWSFEGSNDFETWFPMVRCEGVQREGHTQTENSVSL